MKNIYFLSPKTKWWTYYYYKDISDFLINNYPNEYKIIFCNSLFDYILLHFKKTDVVFSIIPFMFKPIFCKKYIFNLHWNYKIERKNKWLWVKLLYFTELNLWFSDVIMLTSYFLSDKLGFTKKYNNKIKIIPNFIKNSTLKNTQLEEDNFNFLTVTSFKFYEKWKWIINLWNVIKLIWNKYPNNIINFTIVGNENNDNFIKIFNEFSKINFSKNVNIFWKWWLSKKKINYEYLINNTFLYRTNLDNFPWVVIDALDYNLKVYVNNYESFTYFLDDSVICNSEIDMFKKITEKSNQNSELINNFSLKIVIDKIILLIC